MDYLGQKTTSANRVLVLSDLPILTGGITTVNNVATVITNANLTGDVTSIGNASKVVAINNTILSTLGTGLLKITSITGIPSIAVAADFPTLNQNTTGTSSTITSILGVANGGTGASTVTNALISLGLNNINNTSDANKPISIAEQNALNLLVQKFDSSNIKQWLSNTTKTLNYSDTIVISGDLVLDTTFLTLTTSDSSIVAGPLVFNQYSQVYIGGNLILNNSNIVNQGLISVGGGIILIGTSSITGKGLII